MTHHDTLELDGHEFRTLEEFFDEVSRKLIPGAEWGRNLDAFNDILRGGFGTPEGGFTLVWRAAQISRMRLGYAETVRQLRRQLGRCHSSARALLEEKLREAEAGRGPTVFDWLIDIVTQHPNVRLVLA